MQETRTNQTKGRRQGAGNGDEQTTESQGGAAEGSEQQGGEMARQEGAGRTGRSLRRSGSRQLSYASQNPFTMMRQISREMDRLMDSFWGGGLGSLWRETGGRDEDEWQSPALWTPQIDVQQRSDAIVVRADLPGVRKEDVQIEVDDGALIISGQRQEEREEGGQGQGFRRFERSYGSFYRAVPLPQGTNPEQIKAEMRDGVLKVTLPIPESARPRRIRIQT